MTPRQQEILVRFTEYRAKHGISPTMQELADECGVSKVTIFGHVNELVRKGKLTREPHKSRSIMLAKSEAMEYVQAMLDLRSCPTIEELRHLYCLMAAER